MFVDQEKNKPENQLHSPQENNDDQLKSMLIFGGFVVFLLVLILVAFFLMYNMSGDGGGDASGDSNNREQPGKLGNENRLPGESGKTSTSAEDKLINVEAEKLSFGQFYDKNEYKPATTTLSTYALPLNVKTDVANYHDISRKINLDNKIDHLNNAGFARVDDSF
ncbi:MAG TPA: hypothetical protein VKO42_04290, partial [Patescibacteria group bacterium]|nr:hypothetical protein [Patescibacteria group bacterium]